MSEGRKLEEQTAKLLIQLADVLAKYQMWANEPPDDKAMASTAPFACDTMAFEQWLQFIFIPKMQFLLQKKHPLPDNIAILPMGEEMFKGRDGAAQICRVLGKIDSLLNGRQ